MKTKSQKFYSIVARVGSASSMITSLKWSNLRAEGGQGGYISVDTDLQAHYYGSSHGVTYGYQHISGAAALPFPSGLSVNPTATTQKATRDFTVNCCGTLDECLSLLQEYGFTAVIEELVKEIV